MLRVIVAIAGLIIATTTLAQPLDKIVLPPGFAIELVASAEGAREMALGAKGTLFVGSNRPGKVYAIRPGTRSVSEIFIVASGLQLPVGVAFKDGALYVSAVDRILRFDDIENRLTYRAWNDSGEVVDRLEISKLRPQGRASAHPDLVRSDRPGPR